MSLRARLLLLVVLAVLPAVGIEIYGEAELRHTRQGEIQLEAVRLMRLVAAEQQRINEGVRQLLVAFAESAALQQGDWATCGQTAARIRARVEGYVNIGVASEAGELLCSALPIPPDRPTQRPDFLGQMTADGDLLVGRYHTGLITGRKVLSYALRMPAGAGQEPVLVWANIDLDWLARHFADRFASTNLTLLIADQAGTILVRLPDTEQWAGKALGAQYMAMVNAPRSGVVDMVGVDGEDRITAYSPVAREPRGLYLGVGLSKGPYLAPIDLASRNKAILIFLTLILALAAAWLIGSAFIRRPIERLLAVARAWQAGDFAARAQLAGDRSEIGRLGAAFDAMAEAVQRRDGQRREAEEALARLNAELEQRVREEVAAREKAQLALAQAQKIDAVGKLTSGVAHDFNNLLAAVIGNLELLRRHVSEGRARRLVDNAFRAASRGAKLTEQLLAFSRERHSEPEAFDVNALISGMSQMLARTLGPSIDITRALAADAWPALADANQVEVALLNLAINARDAMPQGGQLTIETSNLAAGDPRLPANLAGDFVVIAVSDSGTGMSEAVQARAFEPFFTTKGVGKGTGLGLSMVYGVATQAGGTVTIDSGPGRGTTVTLFLPRSPLPPLQPTAETPPSAPASLPPARVLVVDDDRDVREITAAALSESGLDVTAVESGEAALALIDRGLPFDLIIVDYAMPGINGAEVIARARAQRPQIAVLAVTGYADRGLVSGLPPDVPLLRKPLRVDGLLARVTQALATAPITTS